MAYEEETEEGIDTLLNIVQGSLLPVPFDEVLSKAAQVIASHDGWVQVSLHDVSRRDFERAPGIVRRVPVTYPVWSKEIALADDGEINLFYEAEEIEESVDG